MLKQTNGEFYKIYEDETIKLGELETTIEDYSELNDILTIETEGTGFSAEVNGLTINVTGNIKDTNGTIKIKINNTEYETINIIVREYRRKSYRIC